GTQGRVSPGAVYAAEEFEPAGSGGARLDSDTWDGGCARRWNEWHNAAEIQCDPNSTGRRRPVLRGNERRGVHAGWAARVGDLFRSRHGLGDRYGKAGTPAAPGARRGVGEPAGFGEGNCGAPSGNGSEPHGYCDLP